MKIIESADMSWTETVICLECKSKLEIEKSDLIYVKERNSSVWGPIHDWYSDAFHIKCPICKSTLKLQFEIPNHIKTIVKNS